MNEPDRPDPDSLLAVIQRQEAQEERGKLKIFLGMAAGVGKTYAMLVAAHKARALGIDVVVGFVVTHGRPETEALLTDLEQIPTARIEYGTTVLEEMDTNAILAHKPQLVLVDELAHTNAPGMRHAKRHQDVLELLRAGINVYTTVNVQHFESRADTVRQITGITVRETVPDSILDLADEIELIDLAPEELRKRLAEGKVYTAERSELAARNFFRTGNLTALREMALRLTAEHVDHQLQDYMDIKRIAGPWRSGERLMVAVGPSPFSEKLIRWTRRMAYSLEAPWLAATVETTRELSPEMEQQLSKNLALARDLGAEVVVAAGDKVAQALLQLARQRNVTQVVVGKPNQTGRRPLWKRPSLVDALIDESGDIDVYVVTGDDPEARPKEFLGLSSLTRQSPWRNYLISLLIVFSLTLLDLFLVSQFSAFTYLAVGLIDLLIVLLIAVGLGRGPALLAATVTAITWNFLFIEPRLTLAISRSEDIILFLLYFAVAIIAGNLASRLRSQEQLARNHAERMTALYLLTHEIATSIDMDDVLRMATTQISTMFDADTAILLADGDQLIRQPYSAGSLAISDADYSVAVWAFTNRQQAGRFTNTLPLTSALFVPLQSPDRVLGVLGLRTHSDQRLAFEQERFLETYANQIALAIERKMLDEAATQSILLRESERLFSNLLNSISHELRTPIATIMGAASSLLDEQASGHIETRLQLARDIRDAGDRLNRLVANLLDMSRLESGRLQLKLEWCDINDIISVAVQNSKSRLGDHPVILHQLSDLPLVRLDFVLIEQVILNLLDNACNYTLPGTPIEIDVTHEAETIAISVRDHGPGIDTADLDHIFDKFYRAPAAATGGTGLGLSIAQGLVEAHGGTLAVENAVDGGARFVIKLPASAVSPPVQEAVL